MGPEYCILTVGSCGGRRLSVRLTCLQPLYIRVGVALSHMTTYVQLTCSFVMVTCKMVLSVCPASL